VPLDEFLDILNTAVAKNQSEGTSI
jgi:hypothetical protein